MLNIITKEVPIDEELQSKIQFICDFCNVKPIFINGSIRKIEKTNINYIVPPLITEILSINSLNCDSVIPIGICPLFCVYVYEYPVSESI